MPSTSYTVSAIFALSLSLAIWRFEFFLYKPSRVKCYQRIDTLSPANDSFTCIHASDRSGQVLQLFNHSNYSGSDGSDSWDVSTGYVIPGLWDGHGHVLQYGEMLNSVKLYGAGSVDEPVLNLLPKPFPEIPGGEVITNPGVGVFCDNAMGPVFNVWPRPGRHERIGFLEDAMKFLHSVGVVGAHDAGVLPTDVEILNEWDSFALGFPVLRDLLMGCSLADAGRLTLRFYVMLECPVRNTVCGNETRMVNREDGKLSVRSVKLFADGALGSWGAALLSPYSDKPNVTGSMLIEEEDLYSVTKRWDDLGYQVNIHAIGDRANRAAITAFENILKTPCPQSPYLETCNPRSLQDEKRFRIEHTQIISPEDQERLVSMGIIPSIQPTHATSDMAYALSRLGPERLARSAYRMKSFYNAGLPVILGSDFPVEPPSPFAGIYAAMTRCSPEDGSSENNTCPKCGWYPGEKITLQEALGGFGAHVAWGGFMDGKGVGELKVGGWADWIVLDRDIWAVGEEGIRDAKVLETWVAGRRVWAAGEQPVKPGSSWWWKLW